MFIGAVWTDEKQEVSLNSNLVIGDWDKFLSLSHLLFILLFIPSFPTRYNLTMPIEISSTTKKISPTPPHRLPQLPLFTPSPPILLSSHGPHIPAGWYFNVMWIKEDYWLIDVHSIFVCAYVDTVRTRKRVNDIRTCRGASVCLITILVHTKPHTNVRTLQTHTHPPYSSSPPPLETHPPPPKSVFVGTSSQ